MAKLEKGLVWYHKGLEAEKQLPDFLEVGEPIDSKRIMCTALVAAGLLKPNGKELTLKGQEAVNRLLQHERQQQQEQQQPLPVSPGDSSRGKQAVSQAPAGESAARQPNSSNNAKARLVKASLVLMHHQVCLVGMIMRKTTLINLQNPQHQHQQQQQQHQKQWQHTQHQ